MFHLEKSPTSEVKSFFNQVIITDKETPVWTKSFNPSNKMENDNYSKDWFEYGVKIGGLSVEERRDKLYNLRESFIEKKEEKRLDLLKSELDKKYIELKSIKNESDNLITKFFIGEVSQKNISKNREKFDSIISDIQYIKKEMIEIRSFITGQDFPNKVISIELDKMKGEEISKKL